MTNFFLGRALIKKIIRNIFIMCDENKFEDPLLSAVDLSETASFLGVDLSLLKQDITEGVGFSPESPVSREDEISRMARVDEGFQDCDEGFDAESQPGEASDSEASIFAARMRLKRIQAGEMDSSGGSEVRTVGFKEDTLEKLLSDLNVVSVPTMASFVQQAGYTDQEEAEIAIMGAQFRFDGVSFIRDPELHRVVESPCFQERSKEFLAVLDKVSPSDLTVDRVLEIANLQKLSVVERVSILNAGGFVRSGSHFVRSASKAIRPEIKALSGSLLFKQKVTDFTDEQLKAAWISQLESWNVQNEVYDPETNAQDWTRLMECEANCRGIDLSTLESPDPE